MTSLGIMIGVLSVVMLIALGLGLKNYIKQQFEGLGANLVMILPGSGFGGGGGGFGAGMVGGTEFDERDVVNLQRISDLEYVVPIYMTSSTVESGNEEKVGYIMGVNQELFDLTNIKPYEGELFNKTDVQSRAKVGVLGYTLAEDLFGKAEEAVGRSVRLDKLRIKIIGVAEKEGDPQMDNAVIIPYTTTFGTINPKKTFWGIYLGIAGDDQVETAKKEAEDVLAKRYDTEKFSLTEQSEILDTVNQIFGVLNLILVAIGSISLVVGGIGIMNIMYASVTERTKEIGIRRAIGATKKDILNQFLTESVVLSVLGGFMGLLLAVVLVLIIRIFFPVAINAMAVIIAFGVSSLIGVTFGVFPARRAANLTPIEAIRYE